MNKVALVIGINYAGTDSQLSGCVRDAENMTRILREQLGYTDVCLLTDNTEEKPTLVIMDQKLRELVHRANTENLTEIWIYYAGHGDIKRDSHGDERDGYDEVICPIDYETNGIITDDILNRIFSGLNPTTQCRFVFDCSHSGTILDLPFSCEESAKNRRENKQCKLVNPNIIALSACRDDQLAYEVTSQGGAMTGIFLKVLQEYDYNITCNDLLRYMNKRLKAANYTQRPQICSTTKIGNETIFTKKSDPIKHH
jgi:hypothetical protein